MQRNSLIHIVYLLAVAYSWLIVGRMLLSWFPVRPGSPIFPIKKALFTVTEPYLGLFRRLLPMARVGSVGLDLSATIGLIVLFMLIRGLGRI